jgi:uncharacterized protein YjiK
LLRVAAVVLINASGLHSRLHAQTVASALAAYDFSKDPQQFDLGKALVEVSGLAVDADGLLFAHQDERAVVFELDRGTGRIVRSFHVGRNGLRGDFEGIATAGNRMFLISSDGTLLEFAAGADDESVEYTRSRIGTRASCREIEGLEFDATSESLLLACKFTSGRALRGRLLVLRYSLRTMTLDPKPFLSVSLEGLARFGLKPELSPSGIAINPRTGSIVIVAARENLLVELDRAGAFLGIIELRAKVHHQPEGVAFGADGTLYISDEGRSGRATLTVYPVRGGG